MATIVDKGTCKVLLNSFLEQRIEKMTMTDLYEIYAVQQAELKKGRLYDYKAHCGKSYEKPFKIFGNLYYVGDKVVCSHLIDTGDGLLLFDSMFTGQGGMLVNAIWELGFNPKDIKWIVHSHAHFDHIGQANFFKDMYGSKLYIGAPDAKDMREFPAKAFIQETFNPYEELFVPDAEINDGDIIKFGNTEVKFVMVPGHTPGTLASFFNVTDGSKTMRVGYFGGYGLITLQREYLEEIGDPERTMRQTFLNSIDKVRNEHVDIFIGNHPFDNETIEKHKHMVDHPGENPFIDDTAWGKKLDKHRIEILEFIKADK